MQSIQEVLDKTGQYFEQAGLESPKLEAQWLLAGFLNCKRMDLFLRYDEPLTEPQLAGLRSWVKRRAKGEPLQYILGYADFHELRLAVGPGVLIPRPETEQLVELVRERLAGVEKARIMDLGTGSGAIALALAKAIPQARVLAVDCSRVALQQARANADAHGLRERVAFRLGDWLDGIDAVADAIVANPPYLSEGEWRSARPEVREHEPRDALVAADEGIADLRKILLAALPRLAPAGFVAMEMGIDHGARLAALARSAGFAEVEILRDYQGRERFLFASPLAAAH